MSIKRSGKLDVCGCMYKVITVPDRAVSQTVKSIRGREARGVPDRPLENSTERSRHGRLVRVRRSRWRCVGVFDVSEWKWICWVQWLWMRTEHCLFLFCWWNAYSSKQRLPFPLVFHIPVRTARQTRSLTIRTESVHSHLGSRSHALHLLLLLRLLVSRLIILSALCR
jgi:hypothetical protein